MRTVPKRMKKILGRSLAIVFGLTMLVEVACLPLFNSLAIKFEKTVLAELTDKEDQEEKTESLGEGPLALLGGHPSFDAPEVLSLISHCHTFHDPDLDYVDHAFIKHHSLRL